MNDFQLLETMRAENGVVSLLDRHLERLRASAARLHFQLDLESVRLGVELAARDAAGPARLRLTLPENGDWRLESGAIPEGTPGLLTLAALRVNSSDIRLYHKTTNREFYERARAGVAPDADALLINERNEVTETTIANIAVWRNGQWITPPVRCGLLAGVQRAELLSRGMIVEGVIPMAGLVDGETVRCFNALRGLFDATIRL
ncbi:MAG TPA: aminotransferase class IV [Terriglobia bacterium]|nr:aminotransferase class IV [Terriglobia bacterium]